MVLGIGDVLMRDCWWMHIGDAAVRLAWKLLWSWRHPGTAGVAPPSEGRPAAPIGSWLDTTETPSSGAPLAAGGPGDS